MRWNISFYSLSIPVDFFLRKLPSLTSFWRRLSRPGHLAIKGRNDKRIEKILDYNRNRGKLQLINHQIQKTEEEVTRQMDSSTTVSVQQVKCNPHGKNDKKPIRTTQDDQECLDDMKLFCLSLIPLMAKINSWSDVERREQVKHRIKERIDNIMNASCDK